MTSIKALAREIAALKETIVTSEPPAPVVVWHCKTDRVTDDDRRGAAERAVLIGAPGARVIFCTTHDARRHRAPELEPEHGAAEHPLLGRLRALPGQLRANTLTSWLLSRQIDAAGADHLRAALAREH